MYYFMLYQLILFKT